MQRISLTIPCYNEAERLDAASIGEVLADARVDLVLVDDGSTDATLNLLVSLEAAHPGRVSAVALEHNQGKAEAVRQGMLRGLASGADAVGFFDADFATPPESIRALVSELAESGAQVVLGSRVRLLGRRVERNAARHYLGRVFATAASLALRVPVYDTQCGAKLFADTPALRSALSQPFSSRWIFDVELLGRLLAPLDPSVPALRVDQLREVPLARWTHQRGSKLTAASMGRAGVELLLLSRELGRRGR